jgi:hypothetical protein
MHLFGSHLINKYFDDFRTPNDIDWITNDESEMKNSIVGKEEYYYMPFSPDREMTPNEIYTVKVSHAIYDIHWKKTMSDIRFLQIKGCKVIPDFLKKLREYWVTIHGDQKRTDFEVLPGKFFEDKVRRKVGHDEMHQLLNPNPTYKKITSGDEVTPLPEKFLSLSESDKTDLMFEEAFVIAIERFTNSPDRVAYQFAQQALVTRLHPVWLADYVIQNWNEKYWIPTKSSFYKKYATIKNK